MGIRRILRSRLARHRLMFSMSNSRQQRHPSALLLIQQARARLLQAGIADDDLLGTLYEEESDLE